MDTNQQLRGAAAAVIGARHVRAGRNGQDAAAVWTAGDRGAIVVCDGCGSGASSEVGARLGAQLVLRAVVAQADDRDERDGIDWPRVRAEVGAALRAVAATLPGPRENVVHDYLLFTTVAAVLVGDRAWIWAIGDGAYALDGVVRELGPFENNQPPYLAYDLLDQPQVPHVAEARGIREVMVATDGVTDLAPFSANERYVRHPDALRRQLAVLARSDERIDWEAHRVVRTPAVLQDDGAVAILQRGAA